jgi:hypothetical protein
VTVLSQLISELIRHDGRGKISALLGIDIDEFNINEDNATVIKLNDNNILNNSIIESNSTTTKGMQSRKFRKCPISLCMAVKIAYIHVIRKCFV